MVLETSVYSGLLVWVAARRTWLVLLGVGRLDWRGGGGGGGVISRGLGLLGGGVGVGEVGGEG